VNRNPDIQQLAEKGYAIAFDSNYLVVRDIPYLDSAGTLKIGAIVATLVYRDNNEVAYQDDHQIWFAGGSPHQIDGTRVPLADRPTPLSLSEACKDVVVERRFSNKRKGTDGYTDFFDKVESYVALISGPAMEKYPDATPYTFRHAQHATPDAIFKLHDTMTSRAEITDLAARLRNDVIAVIGLGGSGAYLLDFLVKTPVKEIRAFDLDRYHVHNAYRSPGRLQQEDLGKTKADVYRSRYEDFRHGLIVKPKFIDASCAEDFEGVTFAFVCVDKGSSRGAIFELLMAMGVPFIDVGMGLFRQKGPAAGPLNGLLRATYYPADKAQKVRDKNLAPLTDPKDDLYRTVIQISELNALNACLALIRFKQLRGFYTEEISFYHLVFGLGDLSLDNEDDLN
jgi:hypothetical protein